MRKKGNKESGLTLIELTVAMGIFGLVATMAVGMVVIALVSQRRIISLRNIEDNARFALESMARQIRTGKNFGGGGSSLSFTNAKGESVIYRLNNKTIEKSSDGGANYSVVTGPEVTVDYLNFYPLGQSSGDGLEPRVTITIGITSQVGSQISNTKIQNTVSQRPLQL
ncbi:MAG: prepilin-type N-terminal cleavage/methylation domain-containing protein [Patescibacteria group bacterium]|mgnify:FL=1